MLRVSQASTRCLLEAIENLFETLSVGISGNHGNRNIRAQAGDPPTLIAKVRDT